jgi:hypothetical protein
MQVKHMKEACKRVGGTMKTEDAIERVLTVDTRERVLLSRRGDRGYRDDAFYSFWSFLPYSYRVLFRFW